MTYKLTFVFDDPDVRKRFMHWLGDEGLVDFDDDAAWRNKPSANWKFPLGTGSQAEIFIPAPTAPLDD